MRQMEIKTDRPIRRGKARPTNWLHGNKKRQSLDAKKSADEIIARRFGEFDGGRTGTMYKRLRKVAKNFIRKP